MRELPPDLTQLYGDYLNDIESAAPAHPAPATPPQRAPQPAAAPRPAARPQPQGDPNSRNDQLIFWQLRYQLEAYVRRAARSYGVPHQGGDPATVLDELRRSGFVDEADLRIAEGIFALTDRVTAQGHASPQDYSQALMLYLLYHRSHLSL
jgi:pyruvate/2-oxoglutarate dehydrogenase complex dihydrolipoamide acyltransferase (E2) component